MIEDLAASAGPSIENARRFYEARQLAELDALTGLHNRRYFDEVLDREVARAQRYGRPLTLLLLDLDGLGRSTTGSGTSAATPSSPSWASVCVRRSARPTSRAASAATSSQSSCRSRPPRTRSSCTTASRMRSRHARSPGRSRINASGGVAQLGREDDAVALYRRADEDLYRAKQSGKGHVQ